MPDDNVSRWLQSAPRPEEFANLLAPLERQIDETSGQIVDLQGTLAELRATLDDLRTRWAALHEGHQIAKLIQKARAQEDAPHAVTGTEADGHVALDPAEPAGRGEDKPDNPDNPDEPEGPGKDKPDNPEPEGDKPDNPEDHGKGSQTRKDQVMAWVNGHRAGATFTSKDAQKALPDVPVVTVNTSLGLLATEGVLHRAKVGVYEVMARRS